jgi:hypothetical protein
VIDKDQAELLAHRKDPVSRRKAIHTRANPRYGAGNIVAQNAREHDRGEFFVLSTSLFNIERVDRRCGHSKEQLTLMQDRVGSVLPLEDFGCAIFF